MSLSVALRQVRCFWLAGACLFGALLVLFGDIFDDSVAFTVFALILGLVTMGFGTYVGTGRALWFKRLFGEDEERSPPGRRLALDA